MGHQQFTRTPGRTRLRAEFTDGLHCFENAQYAEALPLFRAADEAADIDDVFQNRYTSFHGLTRVLMGDETGVKLCRKAAVGQVNDAEVYHNLAQAEHHLGYRESVHMALRRGLRINPNHQGLLRLRRELGLRDRHALMPRPPRDTILNRWLLRWLRGNRRPRSD